MGLIHWNDLAIIGAIAIGIVLPELLKGFERWKALSRLAVLSLCCLLATYLTYYLQAHIDPGGAFTRAFLIGITSRIILTMNHIADDQKKARKEAHT